LYFAGYDWRAGRTSGSGQRDGIASTVVTDIFFSRSSPYITELPTSPGNPHYVREGWWFPRGTDLAGIAPAHADHVAGVINSQRRRSLNYQSPATLYAAASTVQ